MASLLSLAHAATTVVALIELGLTAYLVSFYNHYGQTNSPPSLNFALFNAVFSLLTLLYIGLLPLYESTRALFHARLALALEWLAMTFWFSGAIALAAYMRGPYDCQGDTFCGVVETAIAFGFFMWALFLFLVALDTAEALRSRGRKTSQV